MSRARHQLLFHRADEGFEKIEEQGICALDYGTQVVLHHGAEDNRPLPCFEPCGIDTPQRILCLVKGGHKWQSHGPKRQPVELSQ